MNPLEDLMPLPGLRCRIGFLGILDKLKVSILFITHDIEEAIFLSDRIYVLSNRPAKIKKKLWLTSPNQETGKSLLH